MQFDKNKIQVLGISQIFSKIPLEVWNKIVEEEPEWKYMHVFLEKYGFGKFAVLMIALGLNDFQLKGKAEIAYWPKIKEILENKPTPETPVELEEILKEFYSNERLPDLKLRRLKRFLSSELTEELWTSTPSVVAENFVQIWNTLAETMKQSREAKTITFAMKCLGIALLMSGENDFSFEDIPIPVDYRVREFTKRLGVKFQNDEDVRRFWHEVLNEVKKEVPINMIHLDSLIWQIGALSKQEIAEFFSKFGLKEVGEKLVGMIE